VRRHNGPVSGLSLKWRKARRWNRASSTRTRRTTRCTSPYRAIAWGRTSSWRW